MAKITIWFFQMLVALTCCYQMDEVQKMRDAEGPLILPPPKEISHGSELLLIDPCNFQLDMPNKLGADHVTKAVAHHLKLFFPKKRDCIKEPLANSNKVNFKIIWT